MPNLSDLDLFRQIYLIRKFEETVLEEFPKGIFSGTTHTYLGQEANAVGVISHIEENDLIFSNHRCHGHFLAYGGNPRELFAEMMGKPTGVCQGLGGSQHIHYKNFYSNGILGGTIPIAVGTALAEKRKHNNAITIAFLGDGALGEGIVYESLNMASLWNAPILFVIENNHIAQTTPTQLALAGKISDRILSFNIPALEMDTSDPRYIYSTADGIISRVRNENSPFALILNTERFGPHSKGDDSRDMNQLSDMRRMRDPIEIIGSRLQPEPRINIIGEIDQLIRDAFVNAKSDPDYE